MEALIHKLFIFVVLMLVGYFGARRGALGPDFTKAASKLTLNVFMSATILNAVIVNPPVIGGALLLNALFVSFLVLLLGYLVSGLITHLLPLDQEHAPLFELLISVMNPMFIGIPVAELLYGSQGVFYVALSNVLFNLLLYTYGVWRLKSGGAGGLHATDIISAPLVVTVLSVVLFLLRLSVPAWIRELIGSMSGATMPLSMVVIGSSLGRVRLTDALREKSLYLVAALRLVLMPCLTWLLFRVLPAEPMLRGAMIIMSACPSGVVVSILSAQYDRDVEYCSKGILLDTALSMLTIPLVTAFLL